MAVFLASPIEMTQPCDPPNGCGLPACGRKAVLADLGQGAAGDAAALTLTASPQRDISENLHNISGPLKRIAKAAHFHLLILS